MTNSYVGSCQFLRGKAFGGRLPVTLSLIHHPIDPELVVVDPAVCRSTSC
ncbi:MAG: hypothetical protein JRN37_01855 [Nitrososphaerota archaeon]|nr:hypothetical protein [Nitrososphaerota archaeon]MDG7041322.1 hypothetical protein [Nitrososphaerota archaeon]